MNISQEVVDEAFAELPPPTQQKVDGNLMDRMLKAMRRSRKDWADSEEEGMRDMFRSLYLSYRMALKTHIDTGAQVLDVYE